MIGSANINVFAVLQDERFNQEIDKKTGYKTRSILCMPVRNSFGDVSKKINIYYPLA